MESMLSTLVSQHSSFQTPENPNATVLISQAWAVPSGPRRSSLDYIKLWKKILHDTASEFKIHISASRPKAYIRHASSTTNMHEIHLTNIASVKSLYLVFRLHCESNMQRFLETYSNFVNLVDINMVTPTDM